MSTEPTYHQAFPTPEPLTVTVNWLGADVTLSAENTGESSVTISGGDPDHPDHHVNLTGARLDISGGRHTGAGRHGRRRSRRGRGASGLEVVVPRGSALRLDTVAGDITVAGQWGDVEIRGEASAVNLDRCETLRLRTSAGDTTVAAVGSDAVLETASGDINVDRAGGALLISAGRGDITVDEVAGPLNCRSSSGDISVDHARGDLMLATDSGDIHVDAVSGDAGIATRSGEITVGWVGGDASIQSVSGDITVDRLPETGAAQLKTSSGDIQLSVPAAAYVWADISSVTGEIVSRRSGRGEPPADAPYLRLTARSVSGDITVEEDITAGTGLDRLRRRG